MPTMSCQTPRGGWSTTHYMPQDPTRRGPMSPRRRLASSLHLPISLAVPVKERNPRDRTQTTSLQTFSTRRVIGVHSLCPTFSLLVLFPAAPATRSGARCPLVVIRWSRVRRRSRLHYRECPRAYARSRGGEPARRYQRCQRSECCHRFCPAYRKPEGGGTPYEILLPVDLRIKILADSSRFSLQSLGFRLVINVGECS
jgi:hypothetical protein